MPEPSPALKDAPWGDTTRHGHAARDTGIIRNELYVGGLVWDRVRFIKDPTQGPEQLTLTDVRVCLTSDAGRPLCRKGVISLSAFGA